MTATEKRMCWFRRETLKMLVVLSIAVLVQASKDPPKFITPPIKEYTITQGDTVKLICSVTGAEDPMHNRTLTAWKKFGTKRNEFIRRWPRFQVINGQYLRIRKAKIEDSGSYLCVAKNQHGTITAVIKLIVQGVTATNSTLSDVTIKAAPTTVVKKYPVFRNAVRIKALKVTAGKPVKLRCRARGIPTPKIQWHRNNRKLDHFNRKKIRIRKWTLRFTKITQSNSGIYTCFVWNKYGNISKTFIVQVEGRAEGKSFSPAPVQQKPVIRKHLLINATATVGELVTFSCTALSVHVPRFTWLRWSILNNTSNETVKIAVLNSSYPNVRLVRESSRWSGDKMSYCHKLKILNVSEADQGRYSCVVSSSAGFVSSNVYLTVWPKSSIDRTPKDSPSTSNSHFQIPLAALIAIPTAFGVILIVAIIWCYIQTFKHRCTFKKNSLPLAYPVANGTTIHSTANGFYTDIRTSGFGTNTIANGSASHGAIRPEAYPIGNIPFEAYPKGNIPFENTNNSKLHDFQNNSHEQTKNDNALGRSHDNLRDMSPDPSLKVFEEVPDSAGIIPKESHDFSTQNHLEGSHCLDHPNDTLRPDSHTIKENSILQDCDEHSDEINYVRNSIV